MKSTKTMLIAALAAGALLACSPASRAADETNAPAKPAAGAQTGMRGGGRGGPTLEQLTTSLTLTDDQKPKVQAVLDDQKQKMAALRTDTALSQDDRRSKMQAIRTDVTAKMKEILTPEQFTKYEKTAQMGGQRRQNGGGAAPKAAAPKE